MEWRRIPLGPLQTNCYVLFNQQKECILIDPGEEGDRLIAWLTGEELKPLAILLTHAHFDHIGAVDDIREQYHIPVYVHEKEAKWLLDPALNGSQFFMGDHIIRIKPADKIIAMEKEIKIGSFAFQLFETPGHSPGSISYYVSSAKMVFAGDTLFSGSIGRTDLPGGNHSQLMRSIHDHLLTLPEETVVLPGHGPDTTIGIEMDQNPFLHGF
ncbi:glyoxylase-like metal-dependent hydrolase (beta-lactamase superfamily II) [Oikeobacillus pervagus]|uniref:Glyoxylase-like metal-dependent hydrolase (Beta-lactamase superfamily II) n=1 Tax=Oikeobacillus pervagus TaxID=1325931 RepID=A0AAJ1SZ08_9BACI|nr:MBL fold metallo-hydrolase [Oikeobacillus pervagus]MDQ0213862.1 glyoxylase-like metal-dependent hydrolase (beta-lactamase superfamily II) [Oikeobacillus pervagus]